MQNLSWVWDPGRRQEAVEGALLPEPLIAPSQQVSAKGYGRLLAAVVFRGMTLKGQGVVNSLRPALAFVLLSATSASLPQTPHRPP